MSSARRPLLTATAAGTLLCALWFVPSANASQNDEARAVARDAATATTTLVTQQARAVSASTAQTVRTAADETGTDGTEAVGTGADDTELADTGSVDTTPYVIGGSLFLAVGAGFVAYSVRRERLGF